VSGEIEITILGSGSSGGVPRGDGDWGACDPAEPKNRRTRCSALVRRHGPEGVTNVLIDTSPDLREQALANGITAVDAVLYTHDHADQTHGIDDLRVFVMRRRKRIQAFMDAATLSSLEHRFDYIFRSVEGYPALLEPQIIPAHGEHWSVIGPGGGVPVVTFDQAHGPIRSVGYRLGSVSYSSDVSDLDEALRWTPHPTHAHVDKALDWIARADVERAVLTNLHIDLDYKTLCAAVPANVEVAYDGWSGTVAL